MLEAALRCSQHLPEAGCCPKHAQTVVWALAILNLLLLTPARPFPASQGRILTVVTISPCKAWGSAGHQWDSNGWRQWLGCRGWSWDAGEGVQAPTSIHASLSSLPQHPKPTCPAKPTHPDGPN